VIAAQARKPGGGLIVLPSAFSFVNTLIVSFGAQHRLPATYYEWTFTDPGGLIVYGPDYFEDFQPAAGYLDRILANYGCKCQQASGYLSIVRPRRRLASPSADSARHRQPNRIASITEHLKDFREASMFGWGGPTISLL
jgi:hypothetical protein